MKVSTVTGAASGIGAAVAAMLREQGHRVIGVDRRGAEVEVDLATAGGRREAVRAIAALAGERLDHLVCCAGLGPSSPAPLVASVNYFGVVELIDGLLDLLACGRDPSAVVIGSNEAALWNWEREALPAAYIDQGEAAVHARLRAEPEATASHLAYASSKRAVTMAARERASSWAARGVRLNVLAPGATQTPLLQAAEDDPRFHAAVKAFVAPMGRRAEPREMAAAVGFLLGEQASYVHGAVLVADGGIDAAMRKREY